MCIGIFSFRAFDRRLARLAAPISSGVRQGGQNLPPPSGARSAEYPSGARVNAHEDGIIAAVLHEQNFAFWDHRTIKTFEFYWWGPPLSLYQATFNICIANINAHEAGNDAFAPQARSFALLYHGTPSLSNDRTIKSVSREKLLKYRVFHAVFPIITHFRHQLEKNLGGANFYCRPRRVWNGEGFCPCRPPLDPLVGGSMPAWLLVIINNRSPHDTAVLFFLQHASSAS